MNVFKKLFRRVYGFLARLDSWRASEKIEIALNAQQSISDLIEFVQAVIRLLG